MVHGLSSIGENPYQAENWRLQLVYFVGFLRDGVTFSVDS